MATNTPNLILRKPAGTDFVNVELDLNNNWTKVDNTFANSAPLSFAINGSSNSGSLMIVAKADHVHGGPGFGSPVAVGQNNSAGTATTVPRSDHIHQHRDKMVALDTWWACQPGVSQYAWFYLPFNPTSLKLSLMGQIGVSSGPLPAHTHTVNNGGASNTGSVSADHNHVVTVQSGNQDHTHSGSTSGGSSHTHTVSVSAGTSHNHVVSNATQTGSAHEHSLRIRSDFGTNPSLDTSVTAHVLNTDYIEPESSHTHNLSFNTNAEAAHTHTGTADSEAAHTHTFSTGGISANHDHNTVVGGISANHSHAIDAHGHTNNSSGLDGYSDYRYPFGVTIGIDGVDRTAALAGPFGAAGDWSVFDKDIQPYVSSGGWHYLTINSVTAGSGGRLRAYIYAEG